MCCSSRWSSPRLRPALPPEAGYDREPSGRTGGISLLLLSIVSVGAAVFWAQTRRQTSRPTSAIVVAVCIGMAVAFGLASINRVTRLGLLSKMAERVTFVLIPPLALIFLVLGTIFLGVATPTEGGAMGAIRRAADGAGQGACPGRCCAGHGPTAKLTTFVVFILIGARVFSLTFYGVDGHKWVEHLLTDLPGGQTGFLIVVNALVFFLAFFLDFFELCFIVVPLLGPVADKLGIDLIWFGVLLAINMQTSFMHPPFGFALFYLRSVAPTSAYKDHHTGQLTEPVTTGQIYWGAIPFVVIQVIMVGLVIAFPQLVEDAAGRLRRRQVEGRCRQGWRQAGRRRRREG
jgi:TRAP-type mannitol/chloroaromatic compound transport system permease large subunit